MRKLTFALLLTILISSSALAQYYIVPDGALKPDGGLAYDVPVGAPFSVRTPSWSHFTGPAACYSPSLFWQPDTPTYWVAYPLVTVPIGQLPPPEAAPKPTVPSPSLSPSPSRQKPVDNTSSN
jgi:hypothetical protein